MFSSEPARRPAGLHPGLGHGLRPSLHDRPNDITFGPEKHVLPRGFMLLGSFWYTYVYPSAGQPGQPPDSTKLGPTELEHAFFLPAKKTMGKVDIGVLKQCFWRLLDQLLPLADGKQ